MPFFVLSVILQVALVVHIVKTGRNTTWIWIVVMLPLAGSIAYLIVEVLPEIMGSRTARKAKQELSKVINPNKDIKQAAHNYSIIDTVQNSMILADECINKGMYEEARELYKKCLRGVHEDDPDVMYGLANAEFGLNNFSQVKSLLDDLISENPDYKNPGAHLLYAKTLENLGEIDLALAEYKVLDQYYSGPEATFRYAKMLKNHGFAEQSTELFEKILHQSKTSAIQREQRNTST
jgi:hypothetical protein